MEIITNQKSFRLRQRTATAIGKFDGIHIGHRKLLEEILEQKKKGLTACIFTFDKPPGVFFGTSDSYELTTREEKRILFEKMGVDLLIEFPLDLDTARIAPVDFVREILVKQMKVSVLAAGTDLAFGAGGAGNTGLLKKMLPECGFDLKILDKVRLKGEEVSSTLVRRQVEAGNMELAEQLLGRPYAIRGRVIHGNRIGKTLGMPTVNLLPEEKKLLPPFGVYYSTVEYLGREYRSISNIGCKPTVAQEGEIGMETYLYDFDREIYGEEIEVRLLSFKRPEQKFENIGFLKEQLKKDMEDGRKRKIVPGGSC